MALTVGELVAHIRLDQSEYDKGLGSAERKFSGLQKTFASGAKVVAGTLTAAGVAATGLGVAVFKVGADYNRLQQTSRAALSTLLGGAEAANKQMDKLDDFARNSPFAKQTFIVAQQQLLGFGVEAERVIPIMDAVQNAVAAVGGNNEQVASVTYALAQMQGQGKITGQTINQLGQYGIDAATIIGEKMGKSGAEIRKMASKPGGIPVDQIWDPLVDGLMDRFGGATDEIKKQMDGAVDRVKGAWRDIGSIIAAPFIDPMGGGRAVEWTNKLADAMRAAEKKAAPLVDLLIKRYGPTLDKISVGLDSLKSRIDRFDVSKVDTQLDRLSKYTPLIAGVGAAVAALGGNAILGPLAKFVPVLNPIVAGLLALVATSPELREVGRALLDILVPLAPQAGTVAVALANLALESGQRLAPALLDLVQAAGPVAAVLVGMLTPALVGVLQAGTPLVGVVASVVETVAKLPMPVLAGVAAFLALQGPLKAAAPAVTAVAGAFRLLAERAAVQAQLGGVSKGVGALSVTSMSARGAVAGLGAAMKAAFLTNPIGITIATVATAIGIFAKNAADAKARTEAWAATLDELGNTTDDTTRRVNDLLLENRSGWLDNLFGNDMKTWISTGEKFGLTVQDLQGYLLSEADATERVNAAMDTYIENARSSGGAAGRSKADGAKDFRKELDKERDALIESGDAAKRKAELDRESGLETEGATEKVRDNTDALRENSNAKKDAAGAALSQREAELRAADAQDSVTDAIKRANDVRADEKASKDEVARADRAVEKGQLSLVASYTAVRESMVKNGASAEDVRKITEKQRETFIKNETAMGKSKEAAEALADSYGLIPGDVETDIIVNSDEAIGRVEALRGIITRAGDNLDDWTIDADGSRAVRRADGTVVKIDSKTGMISIDGNNGFALRKAAGAVTNINGRTAYLKVDANTALARSRISALSGTVMLGVGVAKGKAAGGVVGFAGGGTVPGTPPGDPRVDNVLAKTQNGTLYGIRSGEWIINEPQSKKNHAWLKAINDGLDLNKVLGAVPGFASGAAVDVARNARVTGLAPTATRGLNNVPALAQPAPANNQPIVINIHSVPTNYVEETAKALNFALRSRGGVYSLGA